MAHSAVFNVDENLICFWFLDGDLLVDDSYVGSESRFENEGLRVKGWGRQGLHHLRFPVASTTCAHCSVGMFDILI